MTVSSSENNTAFTSSVVKRWDFFEFFQYIQFKIKFLIIPVLVCTGMMAVYAFLIAPPVYEGVAQMYVVSSRDSAINLSDLQFGSYIISDYQYIFQTWEVNQQVINNLHLPYTIRQMKEMLTIENPSNTHILKIIFASPNPKEAASVANEYADVAGQYIADRMMTARPSIVSTALEPLEPVRPKKVLLVSAALLLSGLLACWCLFIAFLFDDQIKTSENLKK